MLIRQTKARAPAPVSETLPQEGLMQQDASIFPRCGSGGLYAEMPVSPSSLEATGLPASFVRDLMIKILYRYGVLTGYDWAREICLPFALLDDLLDDLVATAHVEKRGGEGLGNASDRFGVTERGREYARDILEIDTYTGPAPVPLEQYTESILSAVTRNVAFTEAHLREAWSDFIVDDDLFEQIGPAICSGKSCFLYGPPGTGKTTMAKRVARFLDEKGGHVGIPHAVFVGGNVIRVFDPVYHQPVAQHKRTSDLDSGIVARVEGDRRWVLCHRPAVVVGGELTLDMLDLRYNQTTKYYEAPLQMKANGGVFIIDDFGRQLVGPKDLLNRWIVPLEERHDYLTLHTGKKFSVPFEQLVVFATNLNPKDLVDEAFLRRIRYKIFIGAPSPAAYKSIFTKECLKKELAYHPLDLDAMIKKYYHKNDLLLRACDPRDITDRILDFITFNQLSRTITAEMMDQHFAAYLADLRM